jgi:hypothetical protein
MVAFRQYGYSHPKIETACKDVTKPHFSGCAGHVETYLDFGGIMYQYSNVCESAFIPPQHRTFVWSEFH